MWGAERRATGRAAASKIGLRWRREAGPRGTGSVQVLRRSCEHADATKATGASNWCLPNTARLAAASAAARSHGDPHRSRPSPGASVCAAGPGASCDFMVNATRGPTPPPQQTLLTNPRRRPLFPPSALEHGLLHRARACRSRLHALGACHCPFKGTLAWQLYTIYKIDYY